MRMRLEKDKFSLLPGPVPSIIFLLQFALCGDCRSPWITGGSREDCH